MPKSGRHHFWCAPNIERSRADVSIHTLVFAIRAHGLDNPNIGAIELHRSREGSLILGVLDGKRTVLLLSGGVDSTCCLSLLTSAGKTVDCVFVNYDQPAAIAESGAAAEVARHYDCDLRIVRINSDRKFGDGEILGRNAALIFAALLSCEAPPASICIGIHAGTRYFDCTESFLFAIDRLVAESSDGRTRVVAPFITWGKIDLIRFAIDNRVPVARTYSCEAGDQACGKCLSCKDRALIACS